MSADPIGALSELELDALWTVYEGHSLVIERPSGDGQDVRAHVILSVAYDEADEAIAEVAEIPLETVEDLIARGFLELSDDGPVLDAHSWFDEELGLEVSAEEYLLSDLGQRVIDDTAAPDGSDSDGDDEGDYEDEDEDDEVGPGVDEDDDDDDDDDELWDDEDESDDDTDEDGEDQDSEDD